MRVEYHRADYPNGESRFFPLVFLDLIVPNCPRYPTSALVDSGAETSLFSQGILERMGADFENAIESAAYGPDGLSFPVINMPIRATMLGTTVTLQAHWVANHGNFNLLGRADFFKAFRVSFNEREHYMDIEAY